MFRILLITSSYARHEADYAVPWLRESVRRLVRRGHQVTVLAPAYEGLASHTIDGVPVRRFRYGPRALERLTHEEGAPAKVDKLAYKGMAVPYVLAGRRAAAAVAREGEADLVHVHWPFPHGLFAAAAARAGGLPVVATCHGAELALARRRSWVRPWLRRALLEAQALVANSSHTAAEIESLSGRRATVIPFGSTVATRRIVRPPSDRPLILFTGRLIERKGVEFLLRALPQVLARHAVRLVVTGDGDCRPALERLVGELDLSHVVDFEGFVSRERLSELYSRCDVYVLPAVVDSRGDTEGLGVTLIEAFLHERPVVASGVGGIVDVVRHRETGLLVPPADPTALATAIVELLDDPRRARTLAERGRVFAQEYFDWERVTDRIEEVYARTLQLPGSEAAA